MTVARKSKWVRRWEVAASNGGTWIVAQDKDGEYGCSCPVWKFKRQECHHIAAIKRDPSEEITEPTFEYRLAMVDRPQRKDGLLLIPLVAFGNTNQEATVCNFLLEQGWPMGEVRRQRHIPREWTAQAIRGHARAHGEAAFPVGETQ